MVTSYCEMAIRLYEFQYIDESVDNLQNMLEIELM